MKEIEDKKLKPIEKENHAIVLRATALVIDSIETSKKAVEVLRDIKAGKKKVTDFFSVMKETAHKTHKEICDKEKEMLDPIKEAEKVIKKKKSDFDMQEQQRITAEREKREAEARKIEESERKKLEKRLNQTKDTEKREDLKEQIEDVDVQAIPVEDTEKIDGVSMTKAFDIEITDPKTLLQAVIKGSVPIDITKLVSFKVGILKSYLKMSGQSKIPGCRITETVTQRIL